jgi:hypothetical protein
MIYTEAKVNSSLAYSYAIPISRDRNEIGIRLDWVWIEIGLRLCAECVLLEFKKKIATFEDLTTKYTLQKVSGLSSG